MSDFYFIRHGQAGTRLKYDTLSDIGHQQARLLGEYLSRQAVTFSHILVGGLQRHQETANSVLDAYRKDGVNIPDPVIDTDWNEFDLDAVYQSIAPQLGKDDPEFAQGYAAMQRQVSEQGSIEQSVINRRWNPCDSAVIRAWVGGRYAATTCQSWTAFRDRVSDAARKLIASNPEGNVAIFTSATPTAICISQTLGLDDRGTFNLAGVMINSALSVLRLRDGEVRLFNFNTVPHLEDASLRTHR
jgi:broad specificity phosphatase PhoE